MDKLLSHALVFFVGTAIGILVQSSIGSENIGESIGLVSENTVFDFGSIENGEILNHTFTLTNPGDIALNVPSDR